MLRTPLVLCRIESEIIENAFPYNNQPHTLNPEPQTPNIPNRSLNLKGNLAFWQVA